jgi:hypothetical protein
MNENGQCKGIWIMKLEHEKSLGRPRRRWIDAVCQDAREQLGVKRWRQEAEDRKSWRHLIEEVRVRFGL